MKAGAVAAVVFVVAGFGFPQHPQAQAGLTPAEIEEAIALGAAREPRPYLLRHAGGRDNPTVVAAVYTPFLRVAFESHAAVQRGEHLQPAAVRAASTEPLVYLAFRWYCCDNALDPSQPRLSPVEPQVRMMQALAPSSDRATVPTFTMLKGERPVWARRGADVLDTFGARAPYDDIALVAAFPLDSLTTGRTFVVFKKANAVGVPDFVGGIRTGVMRAGDAARWR
jgi:hypothetical protein